MTRLTLMLVFLGHVIGCHQQSTQTPAISLATTTSMQDSGLLDALAPSFEETHSVQIKVIAVGSGQAIELGRRGDVDILLTHAPELETAIVAEGWALARVSVFRSDFVLVGPKDDPARVHRQASVIACFRQIAATGAPFVCRGDRSGTHLKEQALWQTCGIEPSGSWHIESGSGMAATLRMAHEKQAYVLTDRATFLSLQSELGLQLHHEGDPLLDNIYSVMVVNPGKHPHVNAKFARRFVDYLQSPECQRIVQQFGQKRFGQQVFFSLRDE